MNTQGVSAYTHCVYPKSKTKLKLPFMAYGTSVPDPGLVVGHSPKAAAPRAEDYRRVAAEPFAGDLRLSLNAVEVMDVYGAVMRTGVDTMAAGLAKAPAAKSEGVPQPVGVRKQPAQRARVEPPATRGDEERVLGTARELRPGVA